MPKPNITSMHELYDTFSENEGSDIKRYLSLLISNWYWFTISLFIAVSIAYGINRWSEEVYIVSSSLLIKEDNNSGLANIFPGNDNYRSSYNINNEVGILKSFDLNKEVILKLPEFFTEYIAVGKRGIAETRLYKNCPFVVKYDSLRRQTISKNVNITIIDKNQYQILINGDDDLERTKKFGERFNEAGFDFIITIRDSLNYYFNPDASNKYYFRFVSPESLANTYRSKLSVIPAMEETSLMTLSTYGFVREQEIDYLNTLMDTYKDYGLVLKNKVSEQTIDFIKEQLDIISDSLRLAEENLENFRFENNILDISNQGSMVQAELERADNEKAELLLQRKYYEYLKNYLASKPGIEDIVAPSAMGVTDELMISLVRELSGFQMQKKQLSMNVQGSKMPLKLIDSNIGDVRIALNDNINDGYANINKSIYDIEERLKLIETEMKKLPSKERRLINIKRKFDINNTVYTFLLEKRAEAGIARAANVSDNRIIDKAGFYSSYIIKPRKSQNFTIAIILGILVPLILIFIFDYLYTKIIDKKDIERGTSAPVIGYINHNKSKTEMPVVENPGSSLAESFRSVRTYLKYFTQGKESPVIAVSSTIVAEGKTFVSANLAAIIAMSGKKVLLIGLDLRKPRIHKIFGIGNNSGISNFLIGEVSQEDIMVKTEVPNLWYAPSGPVPPNPSELIDSGRMKEFIDRAKEIYDFIIIDTPPVALVTDALLISSFTDFYLFVVRQRYSSKSTLELIEELRRNDNLKSIGIVINDISISGYYGYGLRYGYALGYGYSYGYNYYGTYSGRSGYTDSYYSESDQ